MANITEKIERQITALEGKIDALSGNYLTNTWKRQREQQERDRKKEMYHSQIQVLQFLKQKSETDTLTLLEQNLTVAAFYEDMRCFSASKKYCKDNPYCKFQYPKPDDVRTKRLQKAGITDTDELAAAVECFDTLLQSAVIPPDPNAIRLRDMLYRAKMYQKGDIQFTPPELAKELVALAGVRKDSRVLEPEAGIGNIADAAKEVTDHVDCIERTVTALCPGPTATGFEQAAQMKNSHMFSMFKPASAAAVAEAGFRAAQKGKTLRYCGWPTHTVSIAARLLPRSVCRRFMMKVNG